MGTLTYSNAIDKKWQQKWEDTNLYRFDETKMANKHYLLEMFSYPSGKNLHIGHWWNYSLSDSYGRLKRMQGYEVFHPPGFDAFGLPAENYAIKTDIHPDDSTRENIATMNRQFRTMGTTYNWEHEIVTCNSGYYKWTQWLFLKLFERGLAYRKKAPVNWCPSCMTVLANEQIIGGLCERCETEVTHKNMTQWFFKITEYSEELLSGLACLDWPEKTKRIQENWIGKSYGCEVNFKTDLDSILAYTTRVDTIMGATYIVLAPEHPMVERLTFPEHRAAVEDYRVYVGKMSEIERTSTTKEKTGVFTGSYAVHPITGKQIPIWIADYVLVSYGTGAVFAVPAHDDRDYEFARKYELPIVPVIKAPDTSDKVLPFCEDGIVFNSAEYDGLSSEEARERISYDLEERALGKATVKYRLRDWLVSRQRYWGTPIPIVYCDDCGIVPISEEELPLKLPYNVAFLPNGQSPLAACESFVNTVCPRCGNFAKRDTDTLDTFVCSSWYFLRFLDNKNDAKAFDTERIGKLMPVDKYVGGVEHAAMHLLYARFITKALRDLGFLEFDEPFASLIHQGFILGADGKKMGKRSGAVSPDSIVEQFGVDVFRMYLGFCFSYLDGGSWNEEGIKAVDRFVKRVCRVIEQFIQYKDSLSASELSEDKVNLSASKVSEDNEFEFIRHSTIRRVTDDVDGFRFNTAIARIMEYVNALSKYQSGTERNYHYEELVVKDLILLLAPLAPHLSEELWYTLGYDYSVHNEKWPMHDLTKLLKDIISIAVQVNGDLRSVIEISSHADENELKRVALEEKKVKLTIGEREVKKTIVIKNRLINFVC